MPLVPKFDEKEIERYLFLQSVITGKAKDVYCAMSTSECAEYGLLKETILQTYQIAPDAYRQKFRNLTKEDGQTCVELTREKLNNFDMWLRSMKVEDLDELKQLVLFEECVTSDIRLYLDEQKVLHLHSTAVLDDDYALTHKRSGGFSHNPYPVKSHWSDHNGGKPKGKPGNDDLGHLRRLPVINLTMVKVRKISQVQARTSVLSLQKAWSFDLRLLLWG